MFNVLTDVAAGDRYRIKLYTLNFTRINKLYTYYWVVKVLYNKVRARVRTPILNIVNTFRRKKTPKGLTRTLRRGISLQPNHQTKRLH